MCSDGFSSKSLYVSSLPFTSRQHKKILQAGEWLADGFGAVVFALIGDGDYRRAGLELPSLSSNAPCGKCRCNVTTHKWFEFTATAAQFWKSSLCSCKLFAKDIHLSVLSVFGDWMHDKNSGTDKVNEPSKELGPFVHLI